MIFGVRPASSVCPQVTPKITVLDIYFAEFLHSEKSLSVLLMVGPDPSLGSLLWLIIYMFSLFLLCCPVYFATLLCSGSIRKHIIIVFYRNA